MFTAIIAHCKPLTPIKRSKLTTPALHAILAQEPGLDLRKIVPIKVFKRNCDNTYSILKLAIGSCIYWSRQCWIPWAEVMTISTLLAE